LYAQDQTRSGVGGHACGHKRGYKTGAAAAGVPSQPEPHINVLLPPWDRLTCASGFQRASAASGASQHSQEPYRTTTALMQADDAASPFVWGFLRAADQPLQTGFDTQHVGILLVLVLRCNYCQLRLWPVNQDHSSMTHGLWATQPGAAPHLHKFREGPAARPAAPNGLDNPELVSQGHDRKGRACSGSRITPRVLAPPSAQRPATAVLI
jgi:hypothetical protein